MRLELYPPRFDTLLEGKGNFSFRMSIILLPKFELLFPSCAVLSPLGDVSILALPFEHEYIGYQGKKKNAQNWGKISQKGSGTTDLSVMCLLCKPEDLCLI